MVGLCVPFPARGGCFGVGRSETFQTLSLSLLLIVSLFHPLSIFSLFFSAAADRLRQNLTDKEGLLAGLPEREKR